MNLLAVISVHWNESLAAHLSSVKIFYSTTIVEGKYYLLIQSRKANRQSKAEVVNLVFSFAAY